MSLEAFSQRVQVSLQVNLVLGSTTIGHSIIPAKMLHTILSLWTGWANWAHHHSGTSWDRQLYCSCIFLVLHRHSRIGLPWKCLSFWAMWNAQNPRWKTDECFRKQGLSHFRVAEENQIPNMCLCRLRVQAPGLHVASASHLHHFLPRWHAHDASVPLSTSSEQPS